MNIFYFFSIFSSKIPVSKDLFWGEAWSGIINNNDKTPLLKKKLFVQWNFFLLRILQNWFFILTFSCHEFYLYVILIFISIFLLFLLKLKYQKFPFIKPFFRPDWKLEIPRNTEMAEILKFRERGFIVSKFRQLRHWNFAVSYISCLAKYDIRIWLLFCLRHGFTRATQAKYQKEIRNIMKSKVAFFLSFFFKDFYFFFLLCHTNCSFIFDVKYIGLHTLCTAVHLRPHGLPSKWFVNSI